MLKTACFCATVAMFLLLYIIVNYQTNFHLTRKIIHSGPVMWIRIRIHSGPWIRIQMYKFTDKTKGKAEFNQQKSSLFSRKFWFSSLTLKMYVDADVC